ncbi:MAG: sugar phosphate isomerase/epimerase family protein [Fusobacterium varium]|jgi:sugar phosphate isomerase/epimerase|uniref:sugar phosphate isomerase/epimerase family protein n=1 Tax=Fusobacterium varium TaxID=856 RepID=UPI000E4AECC6|nr:sugar phosphate isomerase/epimerase family protein [Fusobacterium varium]RHG33520.1 sugar phosphate isomerase/epimerase [Fusobacterium varium]
MNKIYVSDLICTNDSYEEIINFFKKNRIKNIEFFIEPYDKEHTEKLDKILKNYSLESVSFHGPYRYFKLTVSEEKWKEALEDFEKAIDIAQKYSGEFLVLHTNEVLEEKIDKNTIERRIKEIVKKAEEKSLKIAVENVGIRKNMLYNQEEYVELIKKYKFYSLIDIGHALLNNWNMEELIEVLKEDIIGYHLHNNDGERDIHQSIFNGKFDFKEIIKHVYEKTPDANLVLEYSAVTPKNELLEDLNILRNFNKIIK